MPLAHLGDPFKLDVTKTKQVNKLYVRIVDIRPISKYVYLLNVFSFCCSYFLIFLINCIGQKRFIVSLPTFYKIVFYKAWEKYLILCQRKLYREINLLSKMFIYFFVFLKQQWNIFIKGTLYFCLFKEYFYINNEQLINLIAVKL